MKATELRALPSEEIVGRIDQLKDELFNLRFQLATGQLENPMRIRQVRKDIARAKTILKQRELGIS
jgi:large subunit ribosomal protein L29